MVYIVSIIAGIILSILSNWLYDLCVARHWLSSTPSKRRFLVTVAALFPLVILVSLPSFISTEDIPEPNASFLPFVSPEDSWCKFQVEYPRDWVSRDANNPVTREVSVFLPSEDAQAKLIIRCVPLSSNASLSNYVDEVVVEQAEKTFPDLQNMTNIETTLANRKAREVSYAVRKADGKWMYREIVALKSGYAYQVTYVAHASEFSKYEGVVEHMLQSLKILEPPQTHG